MDKQLVPRQPLMQLVGMLPWSEVGQVFAKYYCEQGHPAKQVRLRVEPLPLKQEFNHGDKAVVVG